MPDLLTGPALTAQFEGLESRLDCTVYEIGNGDVVEWVEFTSRGNDLPRRIYLSGRGISSDHPRRDRYSVRVSNTSSPVVYQLVINNTSIDDAGRYGCKRVLSDDSYRSNDLLVLGRYLRDDDSVKLYAF